MTTSGYRLPEQDGELFLTPQLDHIEKEILSNREKIKTWNFSIADIPVVVFRKDTKQECSQLTQEYFKKVGLPLTPSPAPDKNGEPYTIVTGHQPGFFHPGVMVKYLLLDQLIHQTNGIGLNITVDSDTMSEVSAKMPSPNAARITPPVCLQKFEEALPLELVPAPDKRTWETFLQNIQSNLEDPLLDTVNMRFHSWRQNLSSLKQLNCKTISDLLIGAQKVFLNQDTISQYNDLPLSRLSGSESFLRFFLHIAKKADLFARAYNEQLGEYRKKHKLRYKANPFPDLVIKEKEIELPFWFIEGHTRKEVWIKEVRGEPVLAMEGRDIGRLPELAESDLLNILPLPIRPKAITLTLFTRMFVSDIFIHGIGGAKYDEVTDGIIKDFFHAEPPGYITATLTKFPEVHLKDHSGEITEKEQLIRDMKFNPDRYAGDEHTQSISKKRELLLEIQKEGADKKNIGKEIKKINQELQHSVIPYIETLEQDAFAMKQEQAQYMAVCRRDLPYFLFSPKQMLQHLTSL